MLEVMWYCAACHMAHACDVSSEPHFFAVILRAKTEHKSISPSCDWNPTNMSGWLFHSDELGQKATPRPDIYMGII